MENRNVSLIHPPRDSQSCCPGTEVSLRVHVQTPTSGAEVSRYLGTYQKLSVRQAIQEREMTAKQEEGQQRTPSTEHSELPTLPMLPAGKQCPSLSTGI